MSKKYILGLYIAIVVLAVAVIGLYFKRGLLGVSSIIDVGGTPSGFNEIRFANEIDLGMRDIPIALSTTTANFSNFEKARVIDALDFKFLSNSTSSLSSFWIVAATSTATSTVQVGAIDPFQEPIGPVAVTFPNKNIWAVFIATSTRATSTPFSLYRYDSNVVTGLGRVKATNVPQEQLVLQAGEALYFHIYHDSVMPAFAGRQAELGYTCNDQGNGSTNCIRNATNTQTGFTRDIVIKYHD